MKKVKPYIIVLLIIGVLLSIKFSFFPGEKKKPNAKVNVQKNTIPVTVFTTGKFSINETIQASGTLLANEEVDLKSEASGSITYLNLPEGKTVTAGTLLVKLNAADIKAQFDKILIQLKLSEEVAFRQKQLLAVKGISQQEYDISISALNTLKADSAFYHAQLLKTELRAPFTGVLGIKNVSPGSYITPAVTISRIQQIDPIKIDFSIPEKYSSLFNVGDPIHFYTEGNSSEFNALISVKDPSVDETNRSVRYRAETRNANGKLMPGAFVRVKLGLKNKNNILFVPTEAIIPILKGKKVFIVKNRSAKETMVETGLRTESFVQIISGLKAGDTVVVNGNHQLKEGSLLKIISPK